MKRVRRVLLPLDDLVAHIEGLLLVVLACALVGTTFAQIVARYILNDPLIWSEEAARYLFVWASMIGAARAMHEGAHANLDFMLQNLPSSTQKVVAVFVTLLVAGFLVILLVTGIQETSLTATQYATTLPITMDLPYLAIPLGAALMLFHLVCSVLRHGLVEIDKREIEA